MGLLTTCYGSKQLNCESNICFVQIRFPFIGSKSSFQNRKEIKGFNDEIIIVVPSSLKSQHILFVSPSVVALPEVPSVQTLLCGVHCTREIKRLTHFPFTQKL